MTHIYNIKYWGWCRTYWVKVVDAVLSVDPGPLFTTR